MIFDLDYSKTIKPIRNSAKAIIISDGKLLLTKNKDSNGIFYLLPGGGQKPGEPLIETLKRECYEEIGIQVIPQELLCIREYIGKNHEFAEFDSDIHQIEFMFTCKIPSNTFPKTGKQKDDFQIGLSWIPLEQLKKIRIYPKVLADILPNLDKSSFPTYLGDIN